MRRALLFLAPIAAIVVAGVGASSARSAGSTSPCQATCSVADAMNPMPGMTAMPAATTTPADAMASGTMSMSQMGSMGPHMTLTAKWSARPGDAERAAQIAATLRASIEKYQDYRVAEQDGYIPFHANIPQPQYHFTNYANAAAAIVRFDPSKPTSLLYAKTSDGYTLVGAMFTAPRTATLDDLNARVPLSIAQWHEHVNLCKGPAGTPPSAYLGPDAKFGLQGSIATADACTATGGTFYPLIYNWMVHVYPFESDPVQIWKVGH
jgi:hypothetical protein